MEVNNLKEVEWNEGFGMGGILHCECDLCGKNVDFKFGQGKKPPFKHAHEKLKEKGWLARKLGEKWYDFCSDKCFEQFKDD
jgi:hypothetical protein